MTTDPQGTFTGSSPEPSPSAVPPSNGGATAPAGNDGIQLGLRPTVILTGTLALTIFAGEVLIMFLLAWMDLPERPFKDFLDASLLVILISPLFYFLLFRPLMRTVAWRKQAEERLGRLVDERTAKLARAQEELAVELTQEAEVRKLLRRNLKELENANRRQAVIQDLLHLSIENLPLAELLGKSIEIIASVEWLRMKGKGCVFLVGNDSKVLELKAQRGMAVPLLEICAHVPFGRCLCGRAAVSRKVVFADCLDERHENCCEGMSPHGHYCVPILAGEKLVGVLNLYVEPGHPFDEKEADFLKIAANVLAGIIESKRVEDERDQALLRQAGLNLLRQSLLATSPLEDKLESITDGIVRLFDADFCRIWLIRPGDRCGQGCIHAQVKDGPHVCRFRDRCLHLLASSGRYTHLDGQGHRRVPFGGYKIGCVASGEEHKFLTNDVPNDPRVHNHEWARELGLVSFAGYQLRVPGGETLGVLALFAKHPISADKDALLDGLGGTAALVIEQARMEQALRESEDRYRSLYANSRDAIMLVSPSAGFLAGNSATIKMFACRDEQEFKSQSPASLSPECQPDGLPSSNKARAMMGQALERGSHFFEWTHKRMDGMEFPATVLLSRFEIGGKPILQATVRDITAQKQAEDALLKTVKDLADANRHLQDSHAQLLQSEKMASIGQLAAGVAHEINNPVGFVNSNLGTLTGYIDTFRKLLILHETFTAAVKEGKAPEQAQVLAEIENIRREEDLPFILKDVDQLLRESLDGTRRVKEIVQGLKSFARLDEAEVKEANVNEGIETTLKLIWNELKYKCTVHKKLGTVPMLRCYPGQLNQVFMNLLVNAAQAIQEKGDITIETGVDDSQIVVRISDTGPGIPEEHLPKLFTPFFTTKPVGKGTGLGLSISYGIVKKHNGDIQVESEAGKGTAFTIRLPLTGGPVEDAAVPSAGTPETPTGEQPEPERRRSAAEIPGQTRIIDLRAKNV